MYILCRRVYIYINIYIYTWMYTRVYIVNIYICVCIQKYIYININLHTHIYIYVNNLNLFICCSCVEESLWQPILVNYGLLVTPDPWATFLEVWLGGPPWSFRTFGSCASEPWSVVKTRCDDHIDCPVFFIVLYYWLCIYNIYFI